MSSADQLAVLEFSERNDLESLLMQFDLDWTAHSLNDYRTRLQSNDRDVFRKLALSELVKIDLQRLWAGGEGPRVEDYLAQMPELGTVESVDPELILAELSARKAVDPDVRLESYASRFPKQYDRVVQLASQIIDSQATSQAAGDVDPGAAQASIDTSRVDNLRNTASETKGSTKQLPTEFGRYRIVRELGSGAMGTVYLAHDSQLDRQVAIKTPSFSGAGNEDVIARFYREARAAAKIQHRNICPVHDVGKIDDRHFISMAFVKGREMSDYIKPDALPPQRTSALLIHRIAIALAEAHRHNVIHRDLKPANIMIDTKREPVVMDFGLARQTDVESRMTDDGTAVGTPAYMSPEQVRGENDDVGPAADIYALGVILYELLTGKLPFRGSIAQVVYKIVNEEPIAPSKLTPGVEPELESICAKMMAKSVDQRYALMDAVAVDLKDYLKGKKKDAGAVPSSSQPHNDSPSKSNLAQVTETGVLNAFFAAQKFEDPTHCSVEIPTVAKPGLFVQTRTKASTGGGGRRVKRIAGGLGGFFLLAGVIVYFADGSRVEIPDGTDAKVETNADGTLKSITTLPASDNTRIRIGNEAAGNGIVNSGTSLKLAQTFDLCSSAQQLHALAITRDGRWLAHSINQDRKLELLDLMTNKVVPLNFESPGNIYRAAFSENGRQLLVGTGNRRLSIFDVVGDAPPIVLQVAQPIVEQLTFSGAYVVAWSVGNKGADPTIERWRRSDWQHAGTITPPRFGRAWHRQIAISNDGEMVAVPEESSIRVWDFATGQPVSERFGDHDGRAAIDVRFSPNGNRLLSFADDGLGRLWDSTTGKRLLLPLSTSTQMELSRADFSPDGRWIVTVRSGKNVDVERGRLILRDARTASILDQVEVPTTPNEGEGKHAFVKLLAISGDGRTIVTAGQATPICVWRVELGATAAKAVSPVSAVVPSSPTSIARRVAERVKLRGGLTDIRFVGKSGGPRIRPDMAIPDEPFHVTRIEIRKRHSISPDDMELFSQTQGPFRMNLFQSGVSDAGLAHFVNSPHLTQLVLRDKGLVTDRGLGSISTLPNLRFLGLNCPKVTDQGFRRLASLTKLSELFLDSPRLTDDILETIKGFENLKTLHLTGAMIDDEDLAELSGLHKLQFLFLDKSKVRGPGLAHLKELPELKILFLSNLKLMANGLSAVSDLSRLESLNLSLSNVRDADLKSLTSLRSLTTLYLADTGVTDEGLKTLGTMSQLSILFLNNTSVTDNGIEHLTGLRQMQSLTLTNTQVSDASVKHLKQLSKLKSLNLNRTNITAKGLAELKKAIPKCKVDAKPPPESDEEADFN